MTDEWTLEQKLAALMALPWTVTVERDETDGSYVAQVAEIPDAIADGATEKALMRDMVESLRESLRVRLAHGDAIPLPPDRTLPWEAGPPPKPRPRMQDAQRIIGGEEFGFEMLSGANWDTVTRELEAA